MKAAGSARERISQSPRFFFFVILFLIVASYSNTLHSPTVLDDDDAVLQSSKMYLDDLSFTSIAELSRTRFGIARFIPLLSFSLNHYFGGGRIIDYHLTNIAIHITTFLFFYLFLRKLLAFHRANNNSDALSYLPEPLFIALAVGLWALSPVQTNAVTYLVQRMTALCALFYVAALFFYLRGRQESRLAKSIPNFSLAGLCALGAFMSKENSATLPIAIIMVELFFVSPHASVCLLKQLKQIKLRYWAIVGSLILLTIPLAEGSFRAYIDGFGMRHFTVWERLMTEGRVVVWYISLLLLPLPSRMNLDHDFPISHSLIEPWGTLPSLVLISALLVTALKFKKINPLYSFGVLWFFLNLVIESTFIPLEIIFEHRLYLPSMGFFVAIAAVIPVIARYLNHQLKITNNIEILFLCILILLSSMSILTTFRNSTWYDVFTIYEDCYLKSPDKPRSIANMGLAYAKSGDQDKAMAFFYEAISKGKVFNEEYVSSANNILTSLLTENKSKEAMIEGERLYKNIPARANLVGMPNFLYTLALAYQRNNKLEFALEAFKEALKTRSDQSKDLYIYDGIVSICREISQEKFASSLNQVTYPFEAELYAFDKVFNVAIESRDYKFAGLALEKIKELSSEKFIELSLVLDDQQAKSQRSAASSDINQHRRMLNDSRYRNNIKIISFINKHYPPLKFVARNLLSTMARDYPEDPFVREMYVGANYDDFLSSADSISKIDDLTEKYSDFPPILSLAAKLYMVKGDRDKALATITTLLNIYPAHPHWLYWEQVITKFRTQNKGNKRNNDGTKIGNSSSAGL